MKNNIEKFEEDFRFQLTAEETADLRSKFLTTNINPKSRYEPYVFTETGIYMLMTVLNGELATRQSKALIRTFKQMKDYLIEEFRTDSAQYKDLQTPDRYGWQETYSSLADEYPYAGKDG